MIPANTYSATIWKSEIDEFKASWPCNGIDARIYRVHFAWDGKTGDLIDAVCFYRNGQRVRDSALYDGPAFLALCDDTQRQMHPEHSR